MAITPAKITLNNIGPISGKHVRYYHLNIRAITSAQKLAIRSATVLGKIMNIMAQHLPLNKLILTSAPEKFKSKLTHIHHHVLENNLDQHFPQTRRSHDRDLAKACLSTKICSVLEKISSSIH